MPIKFILKIINKSFILMTDILITEFINKEKLKEQLLASVWKPKIKTYICRRDREPKRKLLINLEVNDINKIIEKTKKKKKWQKWQKWQKKTGVQRNMK